METEVSVTLTIDGKTVTAQQGESILQCALRHDIDIPHLCTHPALEAFGACRMCVVEVDGLRGYPASCSTPAAADMVVRTDTEELRKLRRNILSLIMLEHPSACLVCDKREECDMYRPKADKAGATGGCQTCNNKEVCEVRTLSGDLGLSSLPVPPTYREMPLERDEPFIDRDLNLCILCGRCVRICKSQQGQGVIDFVNRGGRARIGQAFGRSLYEAGCTFCGSCVDVCPTGSLSDRYAKWQGARSATTETTCQFCTEACAVTIGANEQQCVADSSAINSEIPICLLGRFGIAEFHNGNDRLVAPKIRVGEVLRQVTWEQALAEAAEKLRDHTGDAFALVCDTTSSLEDRALFKAFAADVMKSGNYIEIERDERGVSQKTLPDGVKVLLTTGAFIGDEQLSGLDSMIVLDIYPTPMSEGADVVLPSAAFAEIDGAFVDATGANRPVRQASQAPGEALADWQIIRDLAKAMGAEGFDAESSVDIRAKFDIDQGELRIERDEAPAAALDTDARVTHYRGHAISEKVGGLRAVPMMDDVPAVAVAAADDEVVATPAAGGFAVIEHRELAPNVHEIVIEAPAIAKKANAGQFVILMVDEKSERVPYTLCDWDAEAGTVTLVILEMGRSSRKLVSLSVGDRVAHLVGPLGVPLEVKNYGRVALLGGCYGVGAILGIGKALRAAGNHVVSITEARSHYAHYFADRLESSSDEFIQTTIDASLGVKGHALDVVGQRLHDGEQFDLVIAVGCPFMMMLASRETAPYNVRTLVALNPIMLDGTGMCGACRVSVGDQTKFACVDGPFFDGHLIDWDELKDRRSAYSLEEMRSLARTDAEQPHGHGDHQCSCKA